MILVYKHSNSNNDTICAGKITILVNIGHAPKAWQCLQLKYIYIFVFRSNKTEKYNITMNDGTVKYCFQIPDKRLLHNILKHFISLYIQFAFFHFA